MNTRHASSRTLRPLASRFTALAVLAAAVALAGCDDDKQQELIAKVVGDASIKPIPSVTAAVPYEAGPPPKAKVVCAKGPDVDFRGNKALEAEVYRKLGRDGGTVTQNDLKAIKSVNLSQATINELDPCIFPLFTGVKDLFLGPGDLDDLTPSDAHAAHHAPRVDQQGERHQPAREDDADGPARPRFARPSTTSHRSRTWSPSPSSRSTTPR